MTSREQEIIKLIEANPEISQQEIAEKLDITRSSVAVHISNLMKKGKILGKGYILAQESSLCVIGAVNVDIIATSNNKLIANDSNPGTVTYSFGGVGRNIAENLTRLNYNVELITAIGNDMYAHSIIENCERVNISLRHSLKGIDGNTSTYICLNDSDGDMAVAINAMDIYEKLNAEYIRSKLDVINQSQLVVLDMNLSEETIEEIVKNSKVDIFVDPVSTVKANKIKPYLKYIHTIKPNRLEAELLLDMSIKTEDDIEEAARRFIDIGIKQVVISLGENGVYYASQDSKGFLKNLKCEIVNTTGCGDAFMATLCYGYLEGLKLKDSCKLGLKASKICIESNEAVSKNMNLENLLEE